MMIIYFFNGLCFGSLGLAAYLQLRGGGDFPLRKQLPWLAAFGFACGATYWIDMFHASGLNQDLSGIFDILRIVFQPITGLLLLRFGWGILADLTPLPAWTIFIPGILIVPIAFVITYASTTFITPSPIEIPIDIWSRYLLYLPGSIMAGIGFLRQWKVQRKLGIQDISTLMLGAGMAFLFEAFVVGLVVPAAPYGPASYYNYDRVISNAFTGEQANYLIPFGFMGWLDYARVLETTGLPIEFWRMLSAIAVTFFIVRGLDVFEAVRRRQLKALQEERNSAQKAAFEAHVAARKTAERWTGALVNINRRIAELDNADDILLYIVENARTLLQSDFVGLALLNEDYSNLELKCFSTDSKTEIVHAPVAIKNHLILRSIQTASPYRSQPDESPEMLENVCFYLETPANAVAIVHLNLDNNPIGALWMARSKNELYSETDLIWLECMADQVVIAIQHGLMTSQLQSLSIIEERARIAREMHDGLAQVLGYLNLQVQTIEALQRQGKAKACRFELENMRQAIQIAHADVRENILSLRTTLANEKGPISAISEYLEEFSIQTGIDTEFENEIKEGINLSSIAEVQLVCILKEALTNVRKHAQASHVRVLITKESENECYFIDMKVIDDGVGFALTDSKRRFGLETMRERAHSIDGTFKLHSIPGKGTSIECKLLCLRQEKLEKQSVFFS